MDQSTAGAPGGTTTDTTSDTGGGAPADGSLVAGMGGDTGGGAGGGAATPWYDGLPEELVTPKVQQFQNVEELLRSYQSAQGLVGKKQVALGEVPFDEMTDEQRAQVYQALGRPEAADGYEWTPPEGMTVDQEALSDVLGKFHEVGMTQAQVEAALAAYTDAAAATTEARRQERAQKAQASVQELQQEWGEQFTANLEAAQSALRHFGLTEGIVQAGLGDDANMVRMGLKLASLMREPDADAGNPAQHGTIDEQIRRIKASEAFQSHSHAGHKDAYARYARLMEMKYSGRQ